MKRRILIVDDEATIRESLKDFLEDFDFQVEAAANAEEALALLQRQPCDIMVADLRLPGMSGDAMIIEAHKIQPTLRVIILTGSVDFLPSTNLLHIGIQPQHIMQKPLLDLMVLVEALEDIIRTSL